ncbi:hypothetical protein [Burkholderia cenocepacia]|uniref:hypothetical protein n=1 Tax=Burkholderia cenocepacia TaxID=95486 RepID=UPI002B24FB64|nr:hypothetical protein [Burkholderia cenocepacia]MEB2554049.1 hypothetical protein [Burkholderia cenocepacia]
MLKKLIYAVLMWPLLALAQSYPSPTFQNFTVNGTATIPHAAITGGSINGTPIGGTTPSTGAFTTGSFSGAVSTGSQTIAGNLGLTGSYTAAITTGGAMAQYLSKSGTTGQNIYTGICAGCTSFDAHQSTLTVPSGSTVTTMTGYGSYINNQNGTGTPNSGNGVNYFSVATCGVNNANCWGGNYVLIDNTTYAVSSVTGVKLVGTEYDFTATSTGTTVQGISLLGSSLAQPTSANGFTVGSLSVQNPTIAKWTYGFITQNGVATNAANFGAVSTSGTNVASQPVLQTYFDASGTARSWTYQVAANGSLTLSDSGSGHNLQTNSGFIAKAPSGNGSVTVDTSVASQQSVSLFNDNGTNKYQVGKGTSNDFFAYDTAASRFIWDMPTGGTLAITPATTFAAGVAVTGAISATTTGAMPLYGTTGTGINAPHMVQGTATLSSGAATVTLSGSAVFTSSSSYACTANDTTAAAPVKVSQTSGTSITFAGTGTDVVQFMCAGN